MCDSYSIFRVADLKIDELAKNMSFLAGARRTGGSGMMNCQGKNEVSTITCFGDTGLTVFGDMRISRPVLTL
jgi:hypothetical protein